jgi:hypothetical protein
VKKLQELLIKDIILQMLEKTKMKIQTISTQARKNRTLPANTAIIQLLDKDSNHLAFIACHHEQQFSNYDSENDHELSHFLEEVSTLENEILNTYFEIDKEMEKRFDGWTGEFMITGKNAEIIYHARPVPETESNFDLLKI